MTNEIGPEQDEGYAYQVSTNYSKIVLILMDLCVQEGNG